MADITHNDPLVTESKLTEFYNDIKPFLGCPAYVTQEGDEMYFSFNEKVIGRWTNNKPLYQKTVIFSPAVDVSSTSWTNTPISRGDIEFIINIDGWYDSGTGFQSRPLMAFVDSGSSVVKLLSGRDGVTQDTISGVIFQYTKITDSASTTIEQKPTHYSTDEQVVGTWVDGRPVYQKVITKDSHVVPVNVETVVINTADLLDKTNIEVIDFHGCYYTDVGKAGEQLHQFTGKDGDYGYSAYYRQCDDVIKVYGSWGTLQYTVEKLKFFFQYVKKSDL